MPCLMKLSYNLFIKIQNLIFDKTIVCSVILFSLFNLKAFISDHQGYLMLASI